MTTKHIYLDYAASSPVKPDVLKSMLPYLKDNFGNPSSIHWFGRKARQAVENARKQVARFLNCSPEEIIFTSGGTEADNLAIRGLLLGVSNFFQNRLSIVPASQSQSARSTLTLSRASKSPRASFKKSLTPHIITSAFEHHAVLHTCENLEKQGLAEVTYIKPDKEGIIRIEDIKNALKPNTVLVSIMYVNNEIGTVQPIAEIAKAISSYKLKAISHKLYFHTDAVQAAEYFSCDVKKLGVDMLSLSAHKFGGPKGVGVLYVKKGTPIRSILTGGAQEYKLRAGTENVPAIVGLGKAVEILSLKLKTYNLKLLKLRDYFIDQVLTKIPDVNLNGSRKLRSPNNINVSFKYIEGEAILLNLDLLGIAASSGSACTSGSLSPSHVLLSLGLKEEDAHGSIRFTLGEKTTKSEIDYVVKNLIEIVEKLRKLSPFSRTDASH